MRIVTWNCRLGGAHDELVAELAPDVAVISEWGRLPDERASDPKFVAFGEAGEFGLGVAAFGEWAVSAADVLPISGAVIGAVEVQGPTPFKVVAVWACLSGRPRINPLVEALDAWTDWLAVGPIVVAGDFNTGGAWKDIPSGPDVALPDRRAPHEIGLHSAYHTDRGVEQGESEEPTHWNNRGGPCMIDHVFTPKDWRIFSVKVGQEALWRRRSDHAPLAIDLEVR